MQAVKQLMALDLEKFSIFGHIQLTSSHPAYLEACLVIAERDGRGGEGRVEGGEGRRGKGRGGGRWKGEGRRGKGRGGEGRRGAEREREGRRGKGKGD